METVIKRGSGSPELNRALNGKIIKLNDGFWITTFDYQRVYPHIHDYHWFIMKSFLSFTIYRWSLYNGLNPIKSPWHHHWSHVRPRWPSAVFTWLGTPGFALAVPRMRTALRVTPVVDDVDGRRGHHGLDGLIFFGLESLESRRMVCLCQCLQCGLKNMLILKFIFYVQFWR